MFFALLESYELDKFDEELNVERCDVLLLLLSVSEEDESSTGWGGDFDNNAWFGLEGLSDIPGLLLGMYAGEE